jgi:UDP-N-acetylmuramate: L-alanyl-gamma-D-glutamyl-meso-diaminopimelate ligase
MPRTLHDEFLPGRHPVVVTGTHGKTTTTALTAWLLASAGRSPGYLIGGEPLNFPGPSAIGEGPAFVIEGDEYSTSYDDKGPKFLHYAPKTMIITSIEFDHADLYGSLDEIKAAFRKGVAIVPSDGRIVANADDPNVLDVLQDARCEVLLYSLNGSSGARLLAIDPTLGTNGTRFSVQDGSTFLAEIKTSLSGRHNASNALAAIGACLPFGVTPSELRQGFTTFRSVKRRLEERGTARGVTVIDDFAHHPTAVATTVAGAVARYAGRRVWAAFEPRSITGGRAEFFEPYLAGLSQAHGAAIAFPFHQARLSAEGGPGALDVPRLAERLKEKGCDAFSGATAEDLIEQLLPRLAPGDVVLVMSSGNFGGFCARLLEKLSDIS